MAEYLLVLSSKNSFKTRKYQIAIQFLLIGLCVSSVCYQFQSMILLQLSLKQKLLFCINALLVLELMYLLSYNHETKLVYLVSGKGS